MSKLRQALVGIDVGSKELVVKVEKLGCEQEGVAVFQNSISGHKKLLKYISKGVNEAKVCVEATGIYHLELSLFLSANKKVEVMVVNAVYTFILFSPVSFRFSPNLSLLRKDEQVFVHQNHSEFQTLFQFVQVD